MRPAVNEAVTRGKVAPSDPETRAPVSRRGHRGRGLVARDRRARAGLRPDPAASGSHRDGVADSYPFADEGTISPAGAAPLLLVQGDSRSWTAC